MTHFRTMLTATLIAAGHAWLPSSGQATDDHARGHGAQTTEEEGLAHETTAGHAHAKAFHGGQVAMSKGHRFETVLSPDGIRVYLHAADRAPMMVEKAAGTVTLRFADGTKLEVPLVREVPAQGEGGLYFCPTHEEVLRQEPGICAQCGGTKLHQQDRLFARIDLAKVPPGPLQAVVHVTGLEGAERDATFSAVLTKSGAPAAGTEEAKSEPRPAKGSVEIDHH